MNGPRPRPNCKCGKPVAKGSRGWLLTCNDTACIRQKHIDSKQGRIRKKRVFTCPNCKTAHTQPGPCSAKCRDEYKAKIDRQERIEAAEYLIALAAPFIHSGPVKVLSKEEIEAIKDQITPIEQIPKERFAFIRTGLTL